MVNVVCPYCKLPLMKGGSFYECKDHGLFPVENGIPIFIKDADDSNSAYFQKHWEDASKNKYPPSKLYAASFFLSIPKIDYNGKIILDGGCGDGIHLYWLRQKFPKSILYGVDISKPALNKLRNMVNDINVSCASIDLLPFGDNTFDVVFSYGVIAYTSNPAKSFAELCRVTKEGGYIGVWFYPKPGFIGSLILKSVRKMATKNSTIANILANLIVPFLYILPTSSGVNLSNATWEECKEVVLVNIAPRNLWYPTEGEIIQLFKQENIKIQHIDKDQKITIWGIKGA